MNRIVLATGNQGKLQEMQNILGEYGYEVVSQKACFEEEAEENGLSFVENAIIKARFAAMKTGLPAIADDSGLEVAHLCGEPGIYSSRYSGDGATDASNNLKLLEVMKDVADRKACYYCAMVYVRHEKDPAPLIGIGQWCGEVMKSPEGDGGFGYDPIIWLPEYQCSAAQLSKAQKNKVSHRAQALKELIDKLKSSR